LIICPKCLRPLPDWLLKDSHVSSMCPQCQSAVDVYCFPALYKAEEKLDAAQFGLAEGDACCYEHGTRRAQSICSNCGRFLCALCEVPMGHETFCPDCLNGRQAPVLQRTKFDSIALALATWPVFIFYFVVITAPLAFGMAIYAWKKPSSLVRRSRWRIYLTMGIAALEMAGIVALVVFVVMQVKGRGL